MTETSMKFGRPIFIISPTKRSGTNYVKNVLCQHEDCFSPGPIWEDELLRKAHLLVDYVDFTYQKWNPDWNVEQELQSRKATLNHIGAGLLDLLHAQFSNSEAKKERFSRSLEEQEAHPYRYVTKTPKSDNITLLPALFPDAFLVILVRDGRAVAHSGQTSFSKPFDCAVREWSSAMDEIENFMDGPLFNPKRHILLRYEDLVADPVAQMKTLMPFLDLDPDRIRLDALVEMPVVGSSALRAAGSEVHWTPVEKSKDFDPLARAHELSVFKRSHFAYLAKSSGDFAGYEPSPIFPAWRPVHMLRSAAWWPVWVSWRMSKFAREDVRRSLTRMVRGRARPSASETL